MSPDSEYISLIMYATKLETDLCNFLAIWAVLSILLDTQSNGLQYIKTLQQVVDNYYDRCPMEVMSRLEHQITDIMNAMYDSVTNDNFDSISDDTDRVSGAVDNDYDKDDNDNDQMPYDNDNDQMPYYNDNDQMPYDNDNDTATGEMKYDRNMTNELKDVGTKDMVPYKRDDNSMTTVKWSIETSDIGNDFMREYDVSDNSDSDSHSYLDLAGTNIIPYRMRGQKQRHDENERANTNRHSALKDYTKPNIKVKTQRQKVPDDEDIDIDKIVKGDKPKEDRKSATKIEKQYREKEAKRLVLEKTKRIQIQKDMKDKEAKRFAVEKAQIEALIEKLRPRTPKTPDEVSTSGTGIDGQEGIKKVKPPYKKATKDSQIKVSHKKGEKAKNAEKGNPDTLLGDLVANTATRTEKAKEKGQKDKIGIDDIRIFEFIFHGLPNPPELEGMDEDRLRELQNAVQEQLHQRDKERERNITKRVQEFEKTFDFVNSHLLKGVVTMAELTKTDNRQPMGKIKPTDKMVMMLSLFDGTKPATSKQHYERFNLYINFQTKSGHLTDPVGEAIDLFEHTLDKTALVWFQANRSKFKDLTTLKTMFLQRYNPWGKTKREQLQLWNILSFDPKNTDVDEHIDLINTLGDMVDQKEETKMEKFIEAMPTMIQTHLITCKDWATVKDTAKSLEHIIQKCDPSTPAMPMMVTGATVPGLYSHIAHLVDKEEGKIPHHLKVQNQSKPEVEANLKENIMNRDRTHQKPKRQMQCMHMTVPTIIITMITTMPQVRVESTDLLLVKVVTDTI